MVTVNWGYFDSDGNADAIAQRKDGTLALYRTDGARFIGSPTQVGHGWKNLTVYSHIGYNGANTSGLIAKTTGGKYRYYPMNGKGGFGAYKDMGGSWGSINMVLSGTKK